jgi:hypothetical protein
VPTVATLRSTYLDGYLGRVAGDTKPWTDTKAEDAIEEALLEVWPEIGLFMSATVAANQNSPIYAIPGNIERVSRIVLEKTDAGVVSHIDKVDSWRYHSATEVVIAPAIVTDASLALRFYGWKPFDPAGADLPDNLYTAVCMKAAANAWGQVVGLLTNFEDQLALDSGKVITHQDAVALTAYWQRRYEDRIRKVPGRVSYAPRAASR